MIGAFHISSTEQKVAIGYLMFVCAKEAIMNKTLINQTSELLVFYIIPTGTLDIAPARIHIEPQ